MAQSALSFTSDGLRGAPRFPLHVQEVVRLCRRPLVPARMRWVLREAAALVAVGTFVSSVGLWALGVG